MRKKIISVLLSAAVVMTTLTGCDSSVNKIVETEADEEITLVLWSIATESDAFHAPYTKAIADFEAAHPGVKIKHETFENESYKTKIKATVAANELPDIFFTWGGGFSQSFVESGKVMELDQYYPRYADKLSEAALSNATYDGKLYGSVLVTPVSILWYNNNMFKENGVTVPTTWEEFVNVCQVFVDKGIAPIGTSAKDTWVLAMLHDALTLKSAGPQKVKIALTGGAVNYTDPDFLVSAQKMKELVDMGAFVEGATGLSNDEASADFYAEKMPMYITGSWMAGPIMTDAANPTHFAAAPIPVINNTNARITDFMGGAADTLMVAATTKHPEEAAVAAFELTREISKYAFLSGAGIPAWEVDYPAEEVPALTKQVAAYAANASSFTLWFDTLMDSEDARKYLALLQELFIGNITPEEFTQSMAEQLKK